jgi:hypothetical protein
MSGTDLKNQIDANPNLWIPVKYILAVQYTQTIIIEVKYYEVHN